MQLETTPITVDTMRTAVKEMFNNGWRFITETAVDLGDKGFEILYHFDKDDQMQHLRLSVTKETIIPSISDIYFAALLVENENRDLFGITYDGLILDFNRTLYLEEVGDPIKAPFCKISTFSKPKSSEGSS